MKELIHEVIELDKQAQAKILKLKKEKEELFSAFKSMKDELTQIQQQAIIVEKAQLEASIKSEYDALMEEAKKKALAKEKRISAYYEAHKKEWLDKLLNVLMKA